MSKKDKSFSEYQEVRSAKRSTADEDLEASESIVEKDIPVDADATDAEKAREGVLAGDSYLDKLTNSQSMSQIESSKKPVF